MDYQLYFPRAFLISRCNLWKTSSAIYSDEMFSEAILLINMEQNAARKSSPEDFISLSEALLQDIFDLKHTGLLSEWKEELNFFQFFIASGPAIFLDRRGEYVACHDWFNYCLADIYPAQIVQNIDTSRICDFIESKRSNLKSVFLQVAIDWAASLYHYSRVQSANIESVGELLPFCSRLIKRAIKEAFSRGDKEKLDDAVQSALMISHWVDHYNDHKANEWASYIKSLYLNKELTRLSRARIATSFATRLGSRTEKQPRAWARIALTDHSAHLKGHERLQMLCASIESLADAKKITEQIEAEINSVRSAIFDDVDPNCLKHNYHLDRLFEILCPLINVAVEGRDAKFLYRILAAWYGVPKTSLRPDSPIFIFPSLEDGSAVYFNDEDMVLIEDDPILEKNSKPTIDEMTVVTNRALGTFVTVRGSTQRLKPDFDRPGVPNSFAAQEFSDIAIKYYGLDRRSEQVPANRFC